MLQALLNPLIMQAFGGQKSPMLKTLLLEHPATIVTSSTTIREADIYLFHSINPSVKSGTSSSLLSPHFAHPPPFKDRHSLLSLPNLAMDLSHVNTTNLSLTSFFVEIFQAFQSCSLHIYSAPTLYPTSLPTSSLVATLDVVQVILDTGCTFAITPDRREFLNVTPITYMRTTRLVRRLPSLIDQE